MKAKTLFFTAALLALSLGTAQAETRRVTPLERDWKFARGEQKNAWKKEYNDKSWQQVRVPHDWAIGEDFDLRIDVQMVTTKEDGEQRQQMRTGRTGALPMFGVGWYRREVALPATETARSVWFEFDGAMRDATIWLNGEQVGRWVYGYTSFSVDVTEQFRFGEKNILAVRLENKDFSSRWYSGAGLYRNVRLVDADPLHVPQWGVTVTTPEITDKKATVVVRTEVAGEVPAASRLKVVTTLLDPAGNKAATAVAEAKGGAPEFTQVIAVPQPRRWNLDTPVLYTAVTQLYLDGRLTDEYTTPFGVREIKFDPQKGFFLNGRHVKLNGVCMHHDLGPIGAAVNVRATERQIEILKQMGCNAIRTSHNPPSPELLDLCDRMGMLVQVEAFDEWQTGKVENGYNKDFDEWSERDIVSMLRRDRNHPSVIMWSIGNEIREQGQPEGYLVARRLVEFCHREDPTRPVTAGLNQHHNAVKNGMAAELDLVGFNYKPRDYQTYHEQYPDWVIYGSETASVVSSRGEYKFPAVENRGAYWADYQVSSYDLDVVPWGSFADVEFAAQEDCAFSPGEFVWTGFDYLGEPTPYIGGTPAKSSYFGIVDLAGLKKDRFWLYKAHWSAEPVLHVLPHWDFPDRLGQPVPVMCYTNYPKAELFVNGKSMGMRELQPGSKDPFARYRLIWQEAVYQPGEIKVVAYDAAGNKKEERTVRTTGPARSIRLAADRSTIKAGGKDLSFVTVEVLDKEGNPVPRAADMIFFEVGGQGRLRAVCNGDPIDQTPFRSSYMRLFNGKLIAVIEPGDDAGPITIKAYSGKLAPASATITVEK